MVNLIDLEKKYKMIEDMFNDILESIRKDDIKGIMVLRFDYDGRLRVQILPGYASKEEWENAIFEVNNQLDYMLKS